MPEYGIFVFQAAPADPMAISEEYMAGLERYGAELEALGGKSSVGFAFQPTTTAKSVRGDTVTDGPFLESKEVIAGYYVVEAADLDTAVRIAAANPVLKEPGGGVEVRALFVPPAE
jgi:hypothetical protein